jgi:hypothetical protein
MNWLLPRHREEQEPTAADRRAGDKVPVQPADPYRGVALGVECAWPLAIPREVTHTLP